MTYVRRESSGSLWKSGSRTGGHSKLVCACKRPYWHAVKTWRSALIDSSPLLQPPNQTAQMSSVQVSCQVCYLPFGTIDKDRMPFALSCSHVCCNGCLNVHPSSCPLCYMAYNDVVIRRMQNLGANATPSPPPPSEEENAARLHQLQDAISRIDEQTSLYRLRDIYKMADSFLETQPRNRCKELESNVRLLKALLWSKETLIAQACVVDDFSERYEKASDENRRLRARIANEEYSVDQKVNVRRHLRRNPEFSLLQDEMVQFRTEMNGLHSDVQAFRRQDAPHYPSPPPPLSASRPLPPNPIREFVESKSSPTPPPPILTPTPAYQEASSIGIGNRGIAPTAGHHVKFQLPGYEESSALEEMSSLDFGTSIRSRRHSQLRDDETGFPDAFDDYASLSPPPVPPVYSSNTALPDVGTWAWNNEKEKDRLNEEYGWFGSDADVDPSLLGLGLDFGSQYTLELDARAHSGYVPAPNVARPDAQLTFGPLPDELEEDKGYDGSPAYSREAPQLEGRFWTGGIPIVDNSERARDDQGVPVHVALHSTSSHRGAAELSPLGLSLVSSPEVRPRPPDIDVAHIHNAHNADEATTIPSSPSTSSRALTRKSSMYALLKTPKQYPRLDATYLQTRLHELLEDNLGLGLGRSRSRTSSLGFGLAKGPASLRIPNLDLEVGLDKGQGQGGSSGGGQRGDIAHLKLEGEERGFISPREPLRRGSSRRVVLGTSTPRQVKALPAVLTVRDEPDDQSEAQSSKATSMPIEPSLITPTSTTPPRTVTSPQQPTATSLTLARPSISVTTNALRPRSDSEASRFRSRIPRFAIPKSPTCTTDGEGDDTESDGGSIGCVLQSALHGAFSLAPGRGGGLSGMGMVLDPNALAERFMEELQGCLVEVIARVFVQLLAELRMGASINGRRRATSSAGRVEERNVEEGGVEVREGGDRFEYGDNLDVNNAVELGLD